MIFRTLAAATAVVVIPIAMLGAEAPSRNPNDDNRKVCRVDGRTGSRLGGVQRCRSKAEMDAAKQESRRVVDRMQNMKVDSCPPYC